MLIAGAGLARQEAYASSTAPFYNSLPRFEVNIDSSNIQTNASWENAHTVIDGVKMMRLDIKTYSTTPYTSTNLSAKNYADIVEVDTTKNVSFLATKASDGHKGEDSGAIRTRDFLTNLNNSGIKAIFAINSFNFGSRWKDSTPSLFVSEGTLGTKCPAEKKCPTFVVKKDGTPGLISAIKDGDDLSSFDIAIGSFPSSDGGLILNNAVPRSNSNELHPRTAIGVSQDGKKVYLFTVSGRKYDKYSDGMDLRDVARTLHAFGAHNAINMDGGGSTTMAWWEHGKATESTVSEPNVDGRPNAVNLAVVRK
ncbi:MAG: phosphodiester glycosidase family protein [Paenibacillaceae bacterium]|nr:phosphodiester glycosidase family protein [Paenibacillaceae bacterium]